MSQPLVLKTDKEPTFWNKEMVIGTLLSPVIGTIIGGYIGKNRMEEERANGKVVNEKPSFWNKDTLLGGLIGNLIGGIAGASAFFLATGVTIMAAMTGATIAPAALAIGAVAAVGLSVGGLAAGAYFGGKHGQARLSNEYEEAKKQHIVEHVSKSISPEIGQAVGYTMEHNKQWGKQIIEEKLLATAQQPEANR